MTRHNLEKRFPKFFPKNEEKNYFLQKNRYAENPVKSRVSKHVCAKYTILDLNISHYYKLTT